MKESNILNNPLVSIIIPCYNHESYIVEALNSIVQDTYVNKEIVIIDDGSKDKSVEIIQNWIKKEQGNISIIFKYRENRGITETLNELISLTNGKYLVPLASDDVLINNTLAERVNLLEKVTSKMVLLSDANVIDSSGSIILDSMLSDLNSADKANYYDSEKLIDEIIFNWSISGAVFMVNKEIYSLIDNYPKILNAEDIYFYIKAACKSQIYFWDKKVSKYRVHQTNTSKSNKKLLKTRLITLIITLGQIPTLRRKFKVFLLILAIFYRGYIKEKN